MKTPDLLDIAKAWYRAIKPTPEQQALADERLKVCDTCVHRTEIGVFISCGLCGCPLHKKIFSAKDGGGCPEGLWPH